MDFFENKGLWYTVAGVVVVVILVVVFLPRSHTGAPHAPATTSAPATMPLAPATPAPPTAPVPKQ
jgi:hypothetical protein